MRFAYLALIAASSAGVLVLDWRYRLFVWRAPRRALATVFIGTAVLLVVDIIAIQLGIFRKGDAPFMLGIDLAPHLPIEEPAFLAFLCLLAMVTVGGAERLELRRARSRGGDRP